MNITIHQMSCGDSDVNIQTFPTPYVLSELGELYEDIKNRALNSIEYYKANRKEQDYLLEMGEKKDGLPIAQIYHRNNVIEQVFGVFED